jgi:hypothetical protein
MLRIHRDALPLVRARGIVAESPQESASALSEDLERKARFFRARESAPGKTRHL